MNPRARRVTSLATTLLSRLMLVVLAIGLLVATTPRVECGCATRSVEGVCECSGHGERCCCDETAGGSVAPSSSASQELGPPHALGCATQVGAKILPMSAAPKPLPSPFASPQPFVESVTRAAELRAVDFVLVTRDPVPRPPPSLLTSSLRL